MIFPTFEVQEVDITSGTCIALAPFVALKPTTLNPSVNATVIQSNAVRRSDNCALNSDTSTQRFPVKVQGVRGLGSREFFEGLHFLKMCEFFLRSYNFG